MSTKIILIAAMLLFSAAVVRPEGAVAADNGPVKISFDRDAARIDLLRKTEVPEYGYARRGSVRFHLWNIHEPQDYLTFLHDGVRTAPVASLKSMVKVQEEFSVWILTFKSDGRNSPRVRELAVSFIPQSGDGPDAPAAERVYLRLDELTEIIWEQ